MKLILASKSPRRHQLLKKLLIDIDYPVKDFEIIVPDIDETSLPDEEPKDCAVRLAKEKALSINNDSTIARQHDSTLIITADTIVVLNGKIYSKPTDEQDAIRMLEELNGKTHQVITGFCLLNSSIDPSTHRPLDPIHDFDSSLVTFRNLKKDEIEAFVATKIPMDKAGAYAVQEDTHKFIEQIDGSYTNVMGFPTEKIASILQSFI
ncbi:MAG: Maf family protein [bacterium]|nr:septum formation protein Maf [bacterium]MBU1918713.1 septum formation protein Maf [bacterium]